MLTTTCNICCYTSGKILLSPTQNNFCSSNVGKIDKNYFLLDCQLTLNHHEFNEPSLLFPPCKMCHQPSFTGYELSSVVHLVFE